VTSTAKSRTGSRGRADDRDLRREPPTAGPNHAVRALFDLPRNQRRSPEHPDQQGSSQEERDKELQVVVSIVERTRELAAVVADDGQAPSQAAALEQMVHRRAGRQEERPNGAEPDQGCQSLHPVLTPSEPDHAPTSVRIIRSSSRAGVWLRPPR
jgi:hypothetical protein